MTPILAQNPDELVFTDANFAKISEIAKQRFGLDLQTSKKPLVYSRLTKRLRILGLYSFDDYCAVLDSGQAEDENIYLVSALTTNVTHFFREIHHFEFLFDVLGPAIVARARAGNRIRIWSAACSEGQEAYSIAATLLSLDPKLENYDLRILATDIDAQVIKKAQIARYPSDQKQAIPTKFQSVMLDPGSSANEVQISNAVRSLVAFGVLNLIGPWPMKHPFDVIFCRNAAIYFDKETQGEVWNRFANCLTAGGHLMIGHSERLSGPAHGAFRSAGITTYQKQHSDTAAQTTSIGF